MLVQHAKATVAFKPGHQAFVRETDFRFAVFFKDIKDNIGIVPLTLVFRKAQLCLTHARPLSCQEQIL